MLYNALNGLRPVMAPAIQYCSTNKFSYSSDYMLDYLAEKHRIPREELGETFADAYPVFYWRHFDRFVGYTCGFAAYFAPVIAGAAAVLFLCAIFRKRRLGPLLAAGCRRGTVYLFLTLLYFAFFLLLWLSIRLKRRSALMQARIDGEVGEHILERRGVE